MNTIDDIAQFLQTRPGRVRLVGSGSRLQPLPPATATELDLSACDKIVRLDAGDQTCTVECGVKLGELKEALAEHNIELPCLYDNAAGTIGGLFASDPFGPAAAGCPDPRNLLLGVDALLANGTAFRSGARVVKSVAGFDVHKLLVGSSGRLFVAARLHLRLKPRPRAEQWFANRDHDLEQALTLLHALRTEQLPPTVLQLRRERDGSFSVCGRLTSRSGHVNAMLRRHALEECEPLTAFHVDARLENGEEVLCGMALPSTLRDVLATLPKHAPFSWLGGGRFETALPDEQVSDAVMQRLPDANVTGAILIAAESRSAPTDNRWGTPIDPGELRIAAGLKLALDPDGILV